MPIIQKRVTTGRGEDMEKFDQKKYQQEWERKNGYRARSFKLKDDIYNRFKLACIENGEAQRNVVQQFMTQYIKETEEQKDIKIELPGDQEDCKRKE